MKVKQTLLFQALGDETIVVPVGEASQALHGILRVNATGAAIIQGFVDGLDEETVAALLVDRFDGVDIDKARRAVRETAEKLRIAGLVEEE